MSNDWVRKYIGKPYKSRGTNGEYDCWTLYQHIYQQEKGILIPTGDYTDSNSIKDAENNFNELYQDWERLEKPEPFCLIMLKVGGHPIHVGMCVNKYDMIHTMRGHMSALESYTRQKWKHRIEGFYKWPSM